MEYLEKKRTGIYYLSKLIFIITIILFGGLGCGTFSRNESPKLSSTDQDEFSTYRAYEHFVQGDLYEQSGNIDAAAEEYRKALIFDPSSNEIRRALSDLYFQKSSFDEAAILRSEIENKSAEDYNFIADCLRYMREFESAADFYRRSLEIDPNQYVIRLYLAKILAFTGQNAEAEKEFNKLLETSPDKVEAYLEMGDFYLKTENLSKALESYQKAADQDTSDSRPLVGLAAIYLAQNDTVKAESLYFSLAERNWDNPELLNSIITTFYDMKSYDKAELVAGRVAQLMPDNSNALKRYAMILMGNEKFERAESLMVALEDAGEGDDVIYYYLARIKQQQEDYPSAEEYYRKSLVVNDTLIDGWINLALVIDEQDRYNEAINIMAEAITTNPQDSNAILFFTSAIHARNEKYELAKDGYLRLSISDPDNNGVKFNLGSIYERLGQFEEAESIFKGIIEKDPKNPLALNYLGYMYADKGIKLDEAKGLIEQALEIDPDNGAYLDSYAWVLYKTGKYEEALVYVKRALAADINDPVVYDHQGDIYLALNQRDMAIQSWTKALELDSENETIRAKLNSR